MGDPVTMGIMATVASVGSAGLSAAGSLTASKGQQAGSILQSQKATQAAQYARLQADQTDVQLREELRSTLSNINAIRASAGTDPNAPTALAIKEEQSRVSDRDRNIRTLNLRQQANQYDADAAYYRYAAKKYEQAGYISAAAPILGAVGGGFRTFGGNGMGGGGGSFGSTNSGWALPGQRA